MDESIFNWQQKGWPKASVNRTALRPELQAFCAAFKALKAALKKPQDLEVIARALTDEAVKTSAIEGVDVALKAAMIHPHFESIHPFEDGNGRVGRALVAKVIAEGLGLPLILPISTIIAKHRMAYYDEINEASRYRLNCFLCEPIDPLNEPLNRSLEDWILKIVERHPGVQLSFISSVESSLSKVTIKRAIAALIKSGKVEHRGSKKTGGYWEVA